MNIDLNAIDILDLNQSGKFNNDKSSRNRAKSIGTIILHSFFNTTKLYLSSKRLLGFFQNSKFWVCDKKLLWTLSLVLCFTYLKMSRIFICLNVYLILFQNHPNQKFITSSFICIYPSHLRDIHFSFNIFHTHLNICNKIKHIFELVSLMKNRLIVLFILTILKQ